VEAVLDLARTGQLTITPKAIDVILQSADYLRRWMQHLESGLQHHSSEAPPPADTLIARIRELSSPGAEQPGEPSPKAETTPPPAPPPPSPKQLAALASAVDAPRPAEKSAPETAVPEQRNEALTIKVNTAKLDYLVDMAGEMVIAESLVRHDPDLKAVTSRKLQRNMAQLMRITTELQKTAMSMRLVQVGPLFRRMARLVRDLARQFGKQVDVQMEGEDIELDRTIVEELADPLMHMVRNSLDHGIGTPQERIERGKNPVACLILRGRHQAGQVVIEISDDGRGLDREKIKAKAVEKGIIAPGATLTDSEIHNLIFEPGFSTATRVTNVSGRGVGMDVVRKHIEKLRGRVEIRSTPGKGASFFLRLPLTLAIIDALVVGVGDERYVVPLFTVREMFRPTAETIWTVQQKGEVALIRDALLPVYRLHQKFGVKPRSEDPLQSVLIVAETEGRRFCLLVDELIGKQEVVIKSLGETFKDVTGVAGGAILGDGRVGLILDLERLLKDKTSDAIR
jgi:two-component system chemotaxis sensor kinase CheA